ncbi:hypothetical protein MLD38_030413 [Melastoma candidum]|uniref:Uncharacterized protein n=1 Tax=Melastoma candidum TaxID=119954 RepID=A0ACB9MLQ9_9MYRT|nr:hypothetical protein MLD38_030413 [Melastoma candidum]
MKDTIVLYPSSGKGHLAPMLELAKLILLRHSHSFSITVVISILPHEADSLESYISSVSASAPSISFLRLPCASHPPPASSSPVDLSLLSYELARLNNPTLRQLLLSLAGVKAVVLDFFCSAASEVLTSLGIPTYYFYTSGAYGLLFFLFTPILDEKYPDYKDMDAGEVVEIPGFPPLSPRDMPLAVSDKSHRIYRFFLDTAIDMSKSAGIILNTFEKLETGALELIRGGCVPGGRNLPTYCIGPVVAARSGSGARHGCLTWLDRQPIDSVLFLSFGSMGILSGKQLKEIATGLEKSGVRFVWVARVPRPDDETRRMLGESETRLEAFLPEDFLDRTRERGYMIESWGPQVDILNHPAVGGFVTHCGWNSVLEAICAGVPMLAWPLYAEQKVNRAYLVEKLEVAIPINLAPDDFVSAQELEAGVRELMQSDKGRKARERVSSMKEEAVKARHEEGGTSVVGMAAFIESVGRFPPAVAPESLSPSNGDVVIAAP